MADQDAVTGCDRGWTAYKPIAADHAAIRPGHANPAGVVGSQCVVPDHDAAVAHGAGVGVLASIDRAVYVDRGIIATTLSVVAEGVALDDHVMAVSGFVPMHEFRADTYARHTAAADGIVENNPVIRLGNYATGSRISQPAVDNPITLAAVVWVGDIRVRRDGQATVQRHGDGVVAVALDRNHPGNSEETVRIGNLYRFTDPKIGVHIRACHMLPNS